MFTTRKVVGQKLETEKPTVTRGPDSSHTRKREVDDFIGKIRWKANALQVRAQAAVDQSNECRRILPLVGSPCAA
jgi:hypothetical protein